MLLQGQAAPSHGSVSLHPARNGAVVCTQHCVKVTHPSCLVPRGEGRRVVPVERVSCFSSVKQITLVVAARGCYRSHSAVELGRINEHHPRSPALTAGKSFLGSQPTLWSLLLEDPRPGMPECLTWISPIPAQRIPANGDSSAIETSGVLPGTPARAGLLC